MVAAAFQAYVLERIGDLKRIFWRDEIDVIKLSNEGLIGLKAKM
jgi:hypothetical protein